MRTNITKLCAALGAVFIAAVFIAAVFTSCEPDVNITYEYDPIYITDTTYGMTAIHSGEELAKIGVDSEWPLDGLYYLANDIDLSDYDGGDPWTPIGTAATPFEGRFNGNGKTISGFTIPGGNAADIGLFGYADRAVIRNFTLEITNTLDTPIELTASAAQYFGAVIARKWSTRIEDITLTLEDENDGGIYISKSGSGALVAGGVSGDYAAAGSIEVHSNITSYAPVRAESSVGAVTLGGVAGRTAATYSRNINLNMLGESVSVICSGAAIAAGVLYQGPDVQGGRCHLKSVMARNTASSGSSNVRGVGFGPSSAECELYIESVTAESTNGATGGVTAYGVGGNARLVDTIDRLEVNGYDASGTGSVIACGIGEVITDYTINVPIVVTATRTGAGVGSIYVAGFRPSTSDHLKNLHINAPLTLNASSTGGGTGAIFAGGVSSSNIGHITNVSINSDITINASSNNTGDCLVGGLAGSFSGGTLTGSYITSPVVINVSSSAVASIYAGGIAGSCTTGITRCYVSNPNAQVTVTRTGADATDGAKGTYAGGLIGYGGSISESYSLCKVKIINPGFTPTGTNYTAAGGLAGYLYSKGIYNSYAKGLVEVIDCTSAGDVYAGGLVGIANANDVTVVDKSIALGDITVIASAGNGSKNVNHVAGAKLGTADWHGYADKGMAVIVNTAPVNHSSDANGVAGEGYTHGETATEVVYSDYLGWDFDEIWTWDSALGLPVLR